MTAGTRIVSFSFEGREITAVAGQSIAAALIAAGIHSWRTTRVDRRPRGVFCGIGVCFDCLVEVNGQPGVRACLAEAQEGDRVAAQEGSGHADLAC